MSHIPWIHIGGCGLCRHLRDDKCHHPWYPIPVNWRRARDPGALCGPSGKLWERLSADDAEREK